MCAVFGSILGNLHAWVVEMQENVFEKQETKQASDPAETLEGSLMVFHAWTAQGSSVRHGAQFRWNILYFTVFRETDAATDRLQVEKGIHVPQRPIPFHNQVPSDDS